MNFDFLKADRTPYLLQNAIFTHDTATIAALVEQKGEKILRRRLPLYLDRDPPHPGDRWLKRRAYNRPVALALAVIAGNDATIRVVEDLGGDVRAAVDGNYPNMLFLAAATGQAKTLARWLDAYPVLAQAVNDDRDTLLHVAAIHAQPAVVRLLLARGFDAGRTSKRGVTALHYAERTGHAETMALLRRPLPAAPVASTGWTQLSDDSIARHREDPLVGYRLTETFNFTRQDVTRSQRNLATGEETSDVTPFSEFENWMRLTEAASRLGLVFDRLPDKKGR